MALKISKKLTKHINELCLSEENADVHFKLPVSMKTPKLTKVYYYSRYLTNGEKIAYAFIFY
jgi:hypothetical protein